MEQSRWADPQGSLNVLGIFLLGGPEFLEMALQFSLLEGVGVTGRRVWKTSLAFSMSMSL